MNQWRNCYWLGLILCLLSLILLIWTVWPIKSETREIVFQPGELQVLVPSLEVTGQKATTGNLDSPLAFQDVRKVTLEWTPIIRKGDTSQIKLSFTGSNASNDSAFDQTQKNLSNFENLYHLYSVNAEARIELPGINEEPAGISGKVLPEDRDLEFIWKIIPSGEGLYKGTTWLYLRFFPKMEGDFIDQAVSAQSFEIKVVSFLGLNSNIWRVISVLGIIIGIYIQKKRIIWYIAKANGTNSN